MNVGYDDNPLPKADSRLKYIFVVPHVSLNNLPESEHREKCPGISVQLCSSSLLVGNGNIQQLSAGLYFWRDLILLTLAGSSNIPNNNSSCCLVARAAHS